MERALRGRAVAEEDDRGGVGSLQLEAPRETGRVRDVGGDGNADRRDVQVGRAPPARRVSAPPLQDGRGRQAAEQADRGLAVAREDPVALLERVDGTGLDGLVPVEDRVGPDAALAVIDDRALVVGPQEDERAVKREERIVAEALDAAIGLALVPDHTTQILLDDAHSRSETAFPFFCQAVSDTGGCQVVGFGHVAEVVSRIACAVERSNVLLWEDWR